jgi:hypothetical protein
MRDREQRIRAIYKIGTLPQQRQLPFRIITICLSDRRPGADRRLRSETAESRGWLAVAPEQHYQRTSWWTPKRFCNATPVHVRHYPISLEQLLDGLPVMSSAQPVAAN